MSIHLRHLKRSLYRSATDRRLRDFIGRMRTSSRGSKCNRVEWLALAEPVLTPFSDDPSACSRTPLRRGTLLTTLIAFVSIRVIEHPLGVVVVDNIIIIIIGDDISKVFVSLPSSQYVIRALQCCYCFHPSDSSVRRRALVFQGFHSVGRCLRLLPLSLWSDGCQDEFCCVHWFFYICFIVFVNFDNDHHECMGNESD